MLLYLHFQTRKVKKICFVWAAAVLTGCSSTPGVTADETEQLPSQPVEKVAVYDTDASVPIGARPIGKVSVTSNWGTGTLLH